MIAYFWADISMLGSGMLNLFVSVILAFSLLEMLWRFNLSNDSDIVFQTEQEFYQSINQQQSEMENSSENIKYLFKMMGISKMLIWRRQF